jgi:hypothetical protein
MVLIYILMYFNITVFLDLEEMHAGKETEFSILMQNYVIM